MSEGGNAAALRERWGRPDRAGRAGSGAGPAPSLERAWTETSTGNRAGNRRCPCLRCGKDGRKDSREEGRSRRDPAGSWERLRERAERSGAGAESGGHRGHRGHRGEASLPRPGLPAWPHHALDKRVSITIQAYIYNIDKCVCVSVCVFKTENSSPPSLPQHTAKRSES